MFRVGVTVRNTGKIKLSPRLLGLLQLRMGGKKRNIRSSRFRHCELIARTLALDLPGTNR